MTGYFDIYAEHTSKGFVLMLDMMVLAACHDLMGTVFHRRSAFFVLSGFAASNRKLGRQALGFHKGVSIPSGLSSGYFFCLPEQRC